MDSMTRRHFLRVLAVGSGGVLLAACAQPAQPTPQPAQPAPQPAATPKPAAPAPTAAPAVQPTTPPAAPKFPVRPITLFCPWAAGGGTDAVARMAATLLEQDFGQPVNVVNRTGGGGAVGHTAGATAPRDGYTITIVTVEIAMMKWMKLAEVDPKSFASVCQLNFDPAGVQVRADAPWNTLQELLDEVKANPGKHKASGTGKGGIWDLGRAGMLNTAGISVDAMPWVPSEGAAPGLQELVAGGISVVTASLPEGRSLIEAGRVKPLAIMGEQRDPLFPDTPTLKELGIDWIMGAWRGIGLPKDTGDDKVAVYEAALKKVVEAKEFTDFMANRGFGIRWRTAKEFEAFMDEQYETMGKIMKDVGLIT